MSGTEDNVVTEHKDVEPLLLKVNCIDDSEVTTDKKISDASTMNTTTSEDSEYETLEEDNERSSRSSGSRRSSFSDNHDELSDDIALENEREDGDGQEENSPAKDKKLDDDEDRRNPQYIPKKGTFYEHDDRTMMDENETEEKENETNRREKVEEGEKDPKATGNKKGKVWTEKADRWTHDLYNEDEQKPKSTQELIETYGYDIRNEEAPPKARRRRRYGRGPNKYTRNWEDEDAYTRSAPPQRRVYHNNKEEFPDLEESGRGGRRRREKGQGRSKSPVHSKAKSPVHAKSKSPVLRTPPKQPSIERERDREPRPRRDKEREERLREPEKERSKPVAVRENLPPAFSLERHSQPINNSFPPPPIINKMMERQEKKEEMVEKKVGRGRGFRTTGKPRPTMEFTSRGHGHAPMPATFNREPVVNTQVEDSLKHAAEMLVQDFSHIYINNNNNTNNIVEETIIPRSERRSHHGTSIDSSGGSNEPTGRSKRYSTQRQRSLPESTPPPPTYSPPHNIPYYTQPPPNSYVPAPVYNEVAPPAVTSPPIPMVAFLPPGPPPTAAAAPPYPPPPLLNYMPPPTYPPMALQPPISGQFEDLSQAAELYQGQGGITYYSTQTQNALPRPNPPRRVKLAIPIVPPPDKSGGNNKRNSSNGTTSNSTKQEVQSATT